MTCAPELRRAAWFAQLTRLLPPPTAPRRPRRLPNSSRARGARQPSPRHGRGCCGGAVTCAIDRHRGVVCATRSCRRPRPDVSHGHRREGCRIQDDARGVPSVVRTRILVTPRGWCDGAMTCSIDRCRDSGLPLPRPMSATITGMKAAAFMASRTPNVAGSRALSRPRMVRRDDRRDRSRQLEPADVSHGHRREGCRIQDDARGVPSVVGTRILVTPRGWCDRAMTCSIERCRDSSLPLPRPRQPRSPA